MVVDPMSRNLPTGSMPQTAPATSLDATDILSTLTPAQKVDVAAEFETRTIHRGDILIHEGRPAEALYIALSGRFAVTQAGSQDVISEILAGQPIGEIAFLTRANRTATVTAMRDSVVLRLGREAFDRLCETTPDLWRAIASTLARRLAATMKQGVQPKAARPHTLTLVPAGQSEVSEAFVDRLMTALSAHGKVALLTSQTVDAVIAADDWSSGQEAQARLNALETMFDLVVFVSDPTLTPWSERAIRQADLVISIGEFDSDATPNPVEEFAWRLLDARDRRLVLLHRRMTSLSGTSRWLEQREVRMHHHVCLAAPKTVQRVARFLLGEARGLVASGGGALCVSHIGVFKALGELEIDFDYLGGTSAGAAMMGAFALGVPPDAVAEAVARIFVKNRAMHRYNWPRYGLLDHGNFDEQLRKYFGDTQIEDLWVPFFAAATNLSRHSLEVITSGSLFGAIRASSSIPVLLPPVYSANGEMLVDGCLLDNVPIGTMHDLKSGPNVVISFPAPDIETFDVDYDALPSGRRLVAQSINPLQRHTIPDAPSIINVLMRSLMANRYDFIENLRPNDILLRPPVPEGAGFLDWDRNGEMIAKAYAWSEDELKRIIAEDDNWLRRAAANG